MQVVDVMLNRESDAPSNTRCVVPLPHFRGEEDFS